MDYPKKRSYNRSQFIAIVVALEQMALNAEGHRDCRVAQPFLHDLRRQFEATVGRRLMHQLA